LAHEDYSEGVKRFSFLCSLRVAHKRLSSSVSGSLIFSPTARGVGKSPFLPPSLLSILNGLEPGKARKIVRQEKAGSHKQAIFIAQGFSKVG